MRYRGREPGPRRTQNDYSLAFKLQVVAEVEAGHYTYRQSQKKYGIQGRSTVLKWLRNYGTLDWQKGTTMSVKPSPAKEIRRLERELRDAKASIAILQTAMDIAEQELGINIRKKYLAKLSDTVDNKGRNSASRK